jgi:CRISPR system Cascade subunit CasB
MTALFAVNSPLLTQLSTWWRGLEDARGDRAELRRCHNPAEVALTGAFQRHCPAWRQLLSDRGNFEEPLAAVVGLLAHIKTDYSPVGLTDDFARQAPIAAQMAAPRSKGGGATVSELRFRRLLQQADLQSLYPALVRVLHLMGGRAHIASLADATFFWNDDVRKRWAYAYYSTLAGQR